MTRRQLPKLELENQKKKTHKKGEENDSLPPIKTLPHLALCATPRADLDGGVGSECSKHCCRWADESSKPSLHSTAQRSGSWWKVKILKATDPLVRTEFVPHTESIKRCGSIFAAIAIGVALPRCLPCPHWSLCVCVKWGRSPFEQR